MKRSTFTALAAAVLFAAFPLFASASTFEAGKIVTVQKGEPVASNLYLAGGQVVVTASLPGDVVAAGGNVTVNGPVSGSALVAGGNVGILNDVAGSIRTAGGQVAVSGTVGGDVVAAGGTVTILPGSTVGGDVVVAGGQVDIEGTVKGQVRAYGNDVIVNGNIAGPVSVTAGKSLTFGPDATFGGAVSYTAPQEATVAPGAALGADVTFTKLSAQAGKLEFGFGAGLLALFGVLVLIKFVGTLIAALALQYAFPRFSRVLAEEFVDSFWRSALTGFVALVATPVACVFLALTAVGVYLALLVGALYCFMLIASGVYLCVFTGALLSRWIKKEVRVNWLWTVIGAVATFLIWLVPFVGWVVLAFLFFASFGVVVVSVKQDAEAKLG